jgi:hypothetical protein
MLAKGFSPVSRAAEGWVSCPGVLTILTIPKPFVGHIGAIQRNALESWKGLRDDVQIVLIGDEPGVADVAHEVGVQHVGGIERSAHGTPRLDSAFTLAENVARFPLWLLINADIVLLEDFLPAVDRATKAFEEFVMIGECRDLTVPGRVRVRDATVSEHLRRRALEEGRLRGNSALDYFVFPRGLFDPVPPFLIGRACFDNWLVWRARSRGHAVLDATPGVVAIHQSHKYTHVAGGKMGAYYGDEALHNMRLAGVVRKNPLVPKPAPTLYGLDDVTHRLSHEGPPVPYLWSKWRIRTRARYAGWLMDARVKPLPARAVYLARERLGLLHLRERWFGGRFARD